jgi:dihydropteroate synthase
MVPVEDRFYGSIATVAVAALNGADIVRVHDVKATVDAVRMVDAIRAQIK